MKKKILLLILSCLFVTFIAGGTIGLVACDKNNPDTNVNGGWTDNY